KSAETKGESTTDKQDAAASPSASGAVASKSFAKGASGASSPKPGAAGEAKEEDKTAVKDKPSSGVASFNTGAAKAALATAAAQASSCKRPDGPTGSGKAQITFDSSGKVTSASVGAPFQGTSIGSCVVSVFRRARVPAFQGDAVTVSK